MCEILFCHQVLSSGEALLKVYTEQLLFSQKTHLDKAPQDFAPNTRKMLCDNIKCVSAMSIFLG